MPQQQDAPPDSLVLQTFAGVRNTIAPERLGPGDFETAINIDLDDAGQPRRRRGFTLASSGKFHSMFETSRGTLGVKNGALGWIDPDMTFRQVLANAGNARVEYHQIAEDIYFTSAEVSGVIQRDDTVIPWGTSADPGVWISPVVNPTETLGAVGGRYLSKPPLASSLTHYNGRMYLANKKTLWATELYLYHHVDKTRTFMQFEADITLLGAVDDGIYVGTEAGVVFLQGPNLAALKHIPISNAGVIPGSGVWVPADRVHPQARQGPVPVDSALVFLTTEGWCAAFSGGEVFNLTRDRMVFPAAQSAAALYREQDGVTQAIAVLDSGGTPASTARIGDYVDAEIIRAADRGL